jgi:hypothetical protein
VDRNGRKSGRFSTDVFGRESASRARHQHQNGLINTDSCRQDTVVATGVGVPWLCRVLQAVEVSSFPSFSFEEGWLRLHKKIPVPDSA